MPRLRKDSPELTDKQAAFADNYGSALMSQTESARQAGYADPNHEITRLMENPAIVSRVIDHLRRQATKWQVLVVKAKKTLADAMDAEVTDRFGNVLADTKSRLEAARIVLMTLKRDGKALLEDAATEEDAASAGSETLARRLLGVPAKQDEPLN
jgi:phage terminase small subunit